MSFLWWEYLTGRSCTREEIYPWNWNINKTNYAKPGWWIIQQFHLLIHNFFIENISPFRLVQLFWKILSFYRIVTFPLRLGNKYIIISKNITIFGWTYTCIWLITPCLDLSRDICTFWIRYDDLLCVYNVFI